jgi:hypothetical protein
MPQRSIASHGRSCVDLFNTLSRNLESYEGQLSPAVVVSQSKRFELWARNIAALQDSKLPSSLEYRIREDQNARNIVKKALIYLEESLQIGKSSLNIKGLRISIVPEDYQDERLSSMKSNIHSVGRKDK